MGGGRPILVAVAEGFAGGGAGGEHEVRSVDSPSGGAVNDHGFGFGPGLGVDEHHAALVGGETGVAPGGEDDDDRTERAAELGEDVLVTRWVGLVLAPLEQPAGHETLEPAREQARRDPEVLLELIEARVAVEGVVKDQQGPPLADEAERGRQWALSILEPDLFGHRSCVPPSYCYLRT